MNAAVDLDRLAVGAEDRAVRGAADRIVLRRRGLDGGRQGQDEGERHGTRDACEAMHGELLQEWRRRRPAQATTPRPSRHRDQTSGSGIGAACPMTIRSTPTQSSNDPGATATRVMPSPLTVSVSWPTSSSGSDPATVPRRVSPA